MSFDSEIYLKPKEWIDNKLIKSNNENISQIRDFYSNGYVDLQQNLNREVIINGWPSFSVEDWYLFFDYRYAAWLEQLDASYGNDGALRDDKDNSSFFVPTQEHSAWQVYKNGLLKKWSKNSVEELEKASLGILRRLRLSNDNKPVKGLVVGYVQSGKTASMEGVMAMAADYGWNIFIILSGVVENLRVQTYERIIKDLNQDAGAGSICWIDLDQPSTRNKTTKPEKLLLDDSSSRRYVIVCLKQVNWLKKLIGWIHSNAQVHRKMKILIIDDEADQASVRTKRTKKEIASDINKRKGINKLIVNLVDDINVNKEGDSTNKPSNAHSINYVMYTATPYANFLNEATEESLYPSDFIWLLKAPKEYIGAKEIFGIKDDQDMIHEPLGIVREVDDKDISQIKDIYTSSSTKLPESLKNAICWFISSAAAMRKLGYEKKPISMLIHTSQKQANHGSIADAVSNWLKNTKKEKIVTLCEKVYTEEITRFSKEKWKSRMPEYGGNDYEISNYPSFDDIREGINVLLENEIRSIWLADNGELKYHKSLHLVIDNCANNGINAENEHVRLAYPNPDSDNYPTPAPAFIIIGGSTLSRGLTLEGLVSSYFLRSSCQCDTLMQMGRWFGYRKGYELFPRIWMTRSTYDKFAFLAQLEYEMRKDLKKYMEVNLSPKEYAPKLLATPKVSWLKLTSRMEGAIPEEIDFSGIKIQTVIFDKNNEIINKNIKIIDDFFASIAMKPNVSPQKNSIYWDNVSYTKVIKKLFSTFNFSQRARSFNEMELFCNWLEKQSQEAKFDLNKWVVVAAGKGDVSEGDCKSTKKWSVGGYNIGKVTRTKRVSTSTDDSVDIGVLRAVNDCLADIDLSKHNLIQIKTDNDVDQIRHIENKHDVPMVIIYRVDKDSRPSRQTENRDVLGVANDLVGIFVSIPGAGTERNRIQRFTIDLSNFRDNDEIEEQL